MRPFLIFIFIIMSSVCYAQNLELYLQNLLQNYHSVNLKASYSDYKTLDLLGGTVLMPPLFESKRTGTVDSYRGEIKTNKFLILYDTGIMSGMHMNETLKAGCSIYVDSLFDGYRTIIGLQKKGNDKELVISVLGEYKKYPLSYPANFWAVVKDENEVKDIVDIALSFRTKLK